MKIKSATFIKIITYTYISYINTQLYKNKPVVALTTTLVDGFKKSKRTCIKPNRFAK